MEAKHAPEQLDQLEPLNPRRHFGLPTALGVAIGIALVLTGVSTALYLGSNFSRIDLSKPKNTDIRGQVSTLKEDNSINDSGPVTRDSIKEMIERMQFTQQKLQKAGSFNTPILEDAALGIGASSPQPQ